MRFERLLNRLSTALQEALEATLREIKSQIRIVEVQAAIEANDIESAIRVLFLDRPAFRRFERGLNEGFEDGGDALARDLSRKRRPDGTRLVFRFDARNLEAERIIREHSATRVTGLINNQRLAVRETLEQGLASGRNPRNIALDLVGRLNRNTGRREGGIIGLSDSLARAARNARGELEGGDLKSYLRRDLRNQSDDRTIRRAIRDGKTLNQAQIQRILTNYENNLLRFRGEGVARTEALFSLNAGIQQSVVQSVQSGAIQASQVRRVWDAVGDNRTRADHTEADGQSVGLTESFIIGGVPMLHPGDPAGGAAQVANCRCFLRVEVDFLAGVQ